MSRIRLWYRAVPLSRIMFVLIPVTLALIFLLVSVSRVPAAPTGGTITGIVFEDYNANGVRDVAQTIPNDGGPTAGTIGAAVDRGVGNVTVTAYDPDGFERGSTFTDANGAYTLTVAGTGPYRIEFTILPTGYQPGPYGANSDTTVQFVNDPAGGVIPNVDVAISYPSDYCQSNPDLATACYVFDDQVTGPNSNAPVIVSFPYSAGSNRIPTTPLLTDYDSPPPPHPLEVPANQVGTAYGLSYQRSTGRLFASAFMKRHTGFGPAGIGAIYVITPGTSPIAVSVYANLETLYGAGAAGPNLHSAPYLSDYTTTTGVVTNTWDAVGKTAFGSLAMSEDETRLYAINLFNRTLYALPTNTTPTAGNILSATVPLNPPGCPSPDDVRPFALKFYRGLLYAGMVCSAESTQDPNDLYAYVYSVNPTTLVFSAAPVFSMSLDYPRGVVDRGGAIPIPAAWLPWTPTFRNLDPTDNLIYPQPWLTDLAFDNGDLILAFRDRVGDQGGSGTESNPSSTLLYNTITGGDLLRACGSPSTGWTLENNATCGSNTTSGAGNGQGPGGGEYYYPDDLEGFHDELAMGGMAQLPGYPDAAVLAFDPITRTIGEDPLLYLFDGGYRWFNSTSGGLSKAYRLYNGGFLTPPFFGKANGLGELAPLCRAAPVEIGNRVWRDRTDVTRDGVQGPTLVYSSTDREEPIAGVTVNLYAPGGTTPIATAVTDADGTYYFSNGSGTNTPNAIYNIAALQLNTTGYTIRFNNPLNYATGGPLAGLTPTLANNDASPNGDARDSDCTLPNQGSPIGPGNYPQIVVNIGAAEHNNHTYDCGFHNLPTAVELLYFRVDGVNGQEVTLSWETAVEVDNFGFNLYRASENDFSRAQWVHFEPSAIQGSGTGAQYAYVDTVPAEGIWWYWLADVDTQGGESRHGPIGAVVGPDTLLPNRLYLPVVIREQP